MIIISSLIPTSPTMSNLGIWWISGQILRTGPTRFGRPLRRTRSGGQASSGLSHWCGVSRLITSPMKTASGDLTKSYWKWPIEIVDLPSCKMVDLSMAMWNNQKVYESSISWALVYWVSPDSTGDTGCHMMHWHPRIGRTWWAMQVGVVWGAGAPFCCGKKRHAAEASAFNGGILKSMRIHMPRRVCEPQAFGVMAQTHNRWAKNLSNCMKFPSLS